MEDLARYAVEYAIKRGANYAETRYQKDEGLSILFKNSAVDSVSIIDRRGFGVRVLINGSLGFSSTSTMNKFGIENAIDKAIKIARAASSVRLKPIRFSREKSVLEKWGISPKIKFENVSLEDKIEILKNLDSIALERASDKIKLPIRTFFYNERITEKIYVNSEGTEYKASVPRVSLFYLLTLMGPHGMTLQRSNHLGVTAGWENVKLWKADEEVKHDIESLTRVLYYGKSPPKGRVDVVLGSEVVGLICHEAAGHPSEADRILGREGAQAGESYIEPEMIGKFRIGSEHVNIIEDPTIPGSYGFYIYDDEGVEARKRYIIKRGIINELLHNRETAAEFGISSNGSARASYYNVEPLVRMSNTYFEPGDYTVEELIEDINYGVYINSYMEWNIDDRRWNQRYVGLEAYFIINGELKEPILNPVLEITTKGLFSSVDAVADNLKFYAGSCGKGDPMQPMPVWFGGPDIRLRNVRLGVLGR